MVVWLTGATAPSPKNNSSDAARIANAVEELAADVKGMPRAAVPDAGCPAGVDLRNSDLCA